MWNQYRVLGFSLVVFGLVAIYLLSPLAPAYAANPGEGSCQNITLPVALAAGQPVTQQVAATYCQPSIWASGSHEVDVLTPGATYNRTYWDWPQYPALYSYVDKTLSVGRATLAYDRLGTGQSSHPFSTMLTLQSDAYVLHQLVQWLHGRGYSQVNSEGHSYGSMVAVEEAGTYNDVSRLIVTGLLHAPNTGLAKLSELVYPVTLSPYFIGQKLDLGYLTSIPGSRSVFYSTSADPAVVAYDNSHPDTITATDAQTALISLEVPAPLNVSDRITVPVLLVDGQEDAFFCAPPAIVNCSDQNAVLRYETRYYGAAASLTVRTIPNTGHDLALHPSAPSSFGIISSWITTH